MSSTRTGARRPAAGVGARSACAARALSAAGLALAAGLPAASASASASSARPLRVGTLSTGGVVQAVPGAAGWGLAVTGAGAASARQPKPVELELTASPTAALHRVGAGYDRVVAEPGGGVRGTVRVRLCRCASLVVSDRWRVVGNALELTRRLQVRGTARGGFAVGARLKVTAPATRDAVQQLLPSQIYGGTQGISPNVIGGADSYRPGAPGVARIREDRLPVPAYGLRFGDGSSLTVMDPTPDGRSVRADTEDKAVTTVIDAGDHVSALEVIQRAGRTTAGTWLPGSELPVTYVGGGFTHQLEARPRLRFAPIRNGLVQRQHVLFRFGAHEDWWGFQRSVLREAYAHLAPVVPPQDIPAARAAIAGQVAAQVVTTGGRTGIPLFANAVSGKPIAAPGTGSALMGFVGKNLENAGLMLLDAELHPGPESAARRTTAGKLLDSFTLLEMDPPAGEGFDLATGAPVGYPDDAVTHLQPLVEDMDATVRAVATVRRTGLDPSAGGLDDPAIAAERLRDGRPARGPDGWLAWARGFGDWLLAQQAPDGAFPLSWKAGTDEVVDASVVASQQPAPFLVDLTELTGDERYAQAAARGAERQWAEVQRTGQFTGGILDAPGKAGAVVDVEAPPLSLHAYLTLLAHTGDPVWLERARVAGEVIGGWIVQWAIPASEGVLDDALHFKRGLSTIGLTITVSGQSFADQYGASMVPDLLALARLTRDDHFAQLARLMLHGSKAMLGLPGRTYDLAGPGWQQEGYYLGTPRGRGLNRSWLPWIAATQLDGMLLSEQHDPAAFARISAP